jgi:hypothetical protein
MGLVAVLVVLVLLAVFGWAVQQFPMQPTIQRLIMVVLVVVAVVVVLVWILGVFGVGVPHEIRLR